MKRSTGILVAVCSVLATMLAPAIAEGSSPPRALYATGPSANAVGGYRIGADGSLTDITGSPFALGGPTSPFGIAISPDERNLFTGNDGSAQASEFPVNQVSGALGTPPFSQTAGTNPEGVAITPDGKFTYVTNFGTSNISAYTDFLSPLAGSPFATGSGPTGVAITPDGSHLYTANFSVNTISGFNIDATTGALTPIAGSPFADGGSAPFALTITPDGAHLYAGHAASGNITGFNIGAGGALTPISGSPFAFGTEPRSVGASPKGGILVAADAGLASDIASFRIAADGALTIIGSPVPAGTGPRGAAFTPDGSRVYTYTNGSSIFGNSVSIDGTLSPLPGFPHPSGLAGPTAAQVLGLVVNPDAGPLAAFTVNAGGSGQPTTFNGSISTDPDGTVFRYDWDFGDGTTVADGGPTPSHTYANPGDYTATLTVADNEGCSTKFLFTGQTVACGGSVGQATATQPVHVPDATPPTLSLSGKKTQKLGKSVAVGAECNEACSVTATGQLVVKTKTRKFKLKRATAAIGAGQKKTLKLKLSKKARGAAASALLAGGKAKAKLTVVATDPSGNATTAKRTVKLKKPKH